MTSKFCTRELKQDQIEICRVLLSRADAEASAHILAPEERDRAAAIRSRKTRREFIATRYALREILAAYTGAAADSLRFCYGKWGKPELQDGPQFSVSHSKGLALIAISLTPVGVDVEKCEPGLSWEGVARHFLSAADRSWIASLASDKRVNAFLHCWTRREATVKAIGAGLSGHIASSSGSPAAIQPAALDARSFDISGGYVGAVASIGERYSIFVYDYGTPHAEINTSHDDRECSENSAVSCDR